MSDVLELLLPDRDEEDLARIRRVTTFLRLLASDARSAAAPDVAVDAASASRELEHHSGEQALRALEELARVHLHARLSDDSFHWYGPAALGYEEAWSDVDDLRREGRLDAGFPRPGEDPADVAARLLAAAIAIGLDGFAADLWGSRLARARGDTSEVDSLLDRCSERLGSPDVPLELRAAALADQLAEHLDRGRPRRALDVVAGAPADLVEAARPARLADWCRLLVDPTSETDPPPPSSETGPVPAALLELREEWPTRLHRLAGPGPVGRPPAADDRSTGDRRSLGAVAIGVLRFEPGVGVEPVQLDLAPALAARRDPWLSERDGAWRLPSEPEHRLVLDARPLVVRADGRPPRGAIDDGSLALALAPILDDAGEVAGWLHVECDHHLLPSRTRLARIAAAWRPAVLAPGCEPGRPSVPRPPERPVTAWADAFERLLGGISMGTVHRRWWGVAVEGGSLSTVAEGGDGLGRSEAAGGARALARSLATGGIVQFDDPDPRLSIHGGAASGLAIPAVVDGRVTALLAVESDRRRDFRAADVERLRAAVDAHALALRAAAFRAWHVEHFGVDVHFPAGPGFASFARRLIAGARTQTPLVLSGPDGAGKRVFARWAHFESLAATEPLHVEDGSAPGTVRDGSGSVLVVRLERSPHDRQLELLRSLDRGGAPRLLATCGDSLEAAVEAGRLRSDLAGRLERLETRVPALADRRGDVVELARFLAARFAADEGIAEPVLPDETLGLLWRQPWPGNVRELENVVYRLALVHGGDEVGAEAAREALRSYGVDLVRRLPSRHPRRADVLAALASTRTTSGRVNKTRAALYLGWDPDTLAARLRDLHIEDADVDAPVGWSG